MREAARDAQTMAAGLTRDRLQTGKMEQYALAKALELVGEAASRLSFSFREAHAEVPWRAILGMRHRLVHDYRQIDFDLVWDVVQNYVPPLLDALDHLLPPPPADADPQGEQDQ